MNKAALIKLWTPEELQSLYSKYDNIALAAEEAGMSYSAFRERLVKNGVPIKCKGGPRRPGENRYLENKANGDYALRAKPLTRIVCPRGQSIAGQPRECVLHDDPESCILCESRYAVAVCGTASSLNDILMDWDLS